MTYWWTVFEAYREMLMEARQAQQECLDLIGKRRFEDAKKAGQSRDGYYDCALTALKLLEGA